MNWWQGMLVGVVATVMVVVGGVELTSRLRLKLVCPCGHVIGMHEDLEKCMAAIKREHFQTGGGPSGYEWVECACTKYYGPMPGVSRSTVER